MGKRKFKDGQIVWYTGPDLVTYEQGKTYTVLGYNKAFDMYGILSYLDDEVFLLPDDVLKPLSEEEEKEIRISDRMYEYYQDIPNVRVNLGDIDEKRLKEINEIAEDDVRNSRLKKEADEFLSEPEYNLYLLNLLEESFFVKADIKPSKRWVSEKCLYINEFDPARIIRTDDGEEYDWGSEDRVYDAGWPGHDNEFEKYLGKTTYNGHGGYPVSCCWLFDKKSLLELVNTFPDNFPDFDRSMLDKKQYVVIWCHWD